MQQARWSLKRKLLFSSYWRWWHILSMVVVILRYTMPIRGGHRLPQVYGFQQQFQSSWRSKRTTSGASSTTTTKIITKKQSSFITNRGHHLPIDYRHHHSCLSKTLIFRPLSSLPSSASLKAPQAVDETSSTLGKEDHTVYEELKRLSMEIRRHDELYYDNNGNNLDKEKHNSVTTMISDDEYDALVQREAILCQQHPHLLQKWQDESGLGMTATRFGGRVGAAAASPSSSLSTINGDSTPAQLQPQQQPRRLQHLDRMLSLDNVESNEQLLAWLKRVYKKLALQSSLSSSSPSSNNSSDAPVAAQQQRELAVVTLYTEPKLDGLSLSLRYQYNETASSSSSRSNDDDDDLHSSSTRRRIMTLQWAATRGDGRQGQDVTAAVLEGLVLKNNSDNHHNDSGSVNSGGSIPTSIEWTSTSSTTEMMPLPDILEVRGEVILPQSAFVSFLSKNNQTNNKNSSTMPIFSNARNAASGILLRKLISKETDDNDNADDADDTVDDNSTQQEEQISRDLRKSLRFYAYDVVTDDDATPSIMTNGLEVRQWLQEHGFQVASPVAVTHLTLNSTTGISSNSNGNDSTTTNTTTLTPTTSFWTLSDITPMLEYHDKLGQHRKNGSKDDDSLKWPWGDYEMDGCVHKVADFGLRKELGHSNRAPRWAVAHKFPSQTAITRLLDIEIQVGRTGVLTPVAILEPVDLQGVTVKRATLHNFQHASQILLGPNQSIDVSSSGGTLLERGVPAGCHVLIRRAGEVIPQVLQRVKNVDVSSSEMDNFISLSVPTKCPGCGAPTVVSGVSSSAKVDIEDKDLVMKTNSMISSKKDLAMDATGPVLRCSASTLMCPPRATLAMAHAFSRGALDVRGLSKARIEKLINASTANDDLLGGHRIRQPSDIFRLAQNASKLENLQQLEGWGPKSVQNLANTLNSVATEGVSLTRFIYSLGIRNAGIHASSLIAEAYSNNVDAFLDDVQQAALVSTINHDEEDDDAFPRLFDILRQDNNMTKGIGPILLSELESFARDESLVSAAKDLAQCIRIHSNNSNSSVGPEPLSGFQTDQEMTEKPLDGMTVVFTGAIEGLSRLEAQELARRMGAKATPGTISKSTNLVVRGSKSGKKKTDQAEALGVRIMDVDDFVAMVKNKE